MRTLAFGTRSAKELLRDPLSVAFSLIFYLILLFLLSAIQANIPVSLFEIQELAPGIAVFGLSFLTLFSASLIAKDRESAFLQRLYSTPMTPSDFIFGYTLPLLPIAMAQSLLCYLAALFLGLLFLVNLLYAVVPVIPIAILYISLGLLCGSVLNTKQVGGICGALLINVSGWLSGIWFDLSLVGSVFEKIAYALPFVHAVELEQAILNGNFGESIPHLLWVLGYAVVVTVCAVLLIPTADKKTIAQKNGAGLKPESTPFVFLYSYFVAQFPVAEAVR